MIEVIQRYIKDILNNVTGMKILLLDDATTGVISICQNQSDILTRNILLVQNVNKTLDTSREFKYLHAIYFVRPTNENINIITNHIMNPRFASYNLFFCSPITLKKLERIADADRNKSLVKQVHHLYCDFIPISTDLYSLEISNISDLYDIDMKNEHLYNQIKNGLISALLCNIGSQFIGTRHSKNSILCSNLAKDVTNSLNDRILYDAVNAHPARDYSGCLLIILDRQEDPVTPLLSQWTYRAMLHELLGITRNTVKINMIDDSPLENQCFVLPADSSDEFFAKHKYSLFGELGPAVSSYMESFQKKKQENTNTFSKLSIKDMKRFLEIYPEYRKISVNVTKHVRLIHELSQNIDSSSLLTIGLLEQEIVCSEKKLDHYNTILNIIKDTHISEHDKLRIASLFILRYEGDSLAIKLRSELANSKIDTSVIDNLLEYGGSEHRRPNIFRNKTIMQLAKNVVQRKFQNNIADFNAYTQHRNNSYPFTPYQDKLSMFENGQKEIIIFILGGATYQENFEMSQLALANNCKIILGGSTFHNSKTFFNQVIQYATTRRNHNDNWTNFTSFKENIDFIRETDLDLENKKKFILNGW